MKIKIITLIAIASVLFGCGSNSEDAVNSGSVAPVNTGQSPSTPQTTGTATAPPEDPNSDASQGGLEQVNPGQPGSRD